MEQKLRQRNYDGNTSDKRNHDERNHDRIRVEQLKRTVRLIVGKDLVRIKRAFGNKS